MAGDMLVGLDIDGTIAEYHQHFIRFAQEWLGDPYIPLMYTGDVSMHKHCGVGRQRYRACKLAYRQSGLKRAMPLLEPNVPDVVRSWRKAGAQVWICTTRPYKLVPNIEPDTEEWLRRNRIPYDGLIMGDRKYQELARVAGPESVAAVIDDLPEMCQQAGRLGIPAFLRGRPHNTSSYDRMNVVGSLEEAEPLVLATIDERRARRAATPVVRQRRLAGR